MPSWTTQIPEKFKKEDLPVAATFLSNKKNPALIVKLESPEEIATTDGSVRRKQGTGYEIRFYGHVYKTRNARTVELLLAHSAFNRGYNGYSIDHHDPTGFWRAGGAVEEQTIKTFVPKATYTVSGDFNPKSKEFKDALKKMQANEEEPVAPLVGTA